MNELELRTLNEVRAKHGLPPVTESDAISAARRAGFSGKEAVDYCLQNPTSLFYTLGYVSGAALHDTDLLASE